MEMSEASALPGEPDGYERLWTPHRMVYIDGENKPPDSSSTACPFCRSQGVDDAEGLIVHRGTKVFTVMNLYPYNNGHLMVCPNRHVADYTELSADERVELAEETAVAMNVIRHVMHPNGFNIGMNQGAVAGAGIAAHLHQHVVPRWGGDSNFLPIIARTKAVPQLIDDVRLALTSAWPQEGSDAQ